MHKKELSLKTKKGGKMMNKKKKSWKNWIMFSTSALLFTAVSLLKVDTAFAAFGSGGSTQEPKTIYHWDGRTPGKGSPTYITFNPKYRNSKGQPSPQYKAYGANTRFWEEFYRNEFHWYSIVPRKNPTAEQMNMQRMLENRQTKLGKNGAYLVNPSYSLNLKKGRVDPYTRKYMGDETGTTLITTGPYKGHHYEWRYLGYTMDGEPVNNPYFPDDYTEKKDWSTIQWLTLEEAEKKGLIESTVYDDNFSQKKKWIKEKLLSVHPELKRKGYSLDKSADYLARVFSIRSNPDTSTGIVTGWFVKNGRIRYATFTMQKPLKPNLRLISYKIYEKKDDGSLKLIAEVTRDANNNDNIDTVVKRYKKEVTKGKTYVFEATVKNMKQKGMSSYNTKYKPITLDHMYAFDENAFEFNSYDETYEGGSGAKPTQKVSSIPYGGTVTFKWEYKIPTSAQKYVLMGAVIPYGFFQAGDNIFTGDDKSEVLFEVEKEDIAIVSKIELVDRNGNVVNEVVPNWTYSLRYYVTKPLGSSIVGDPKNPDNNPFASIDVKVSDLATVQHNYVDQRAKVSLKPKGTVMIEVPNAITPKTSCIYTEAVINQKHRLNGQSSDYTNDGPVKKKFCSDINISVKDFEIKPQSVKIPYGDPNPRENLTLTFTVTNYNKEGQTKSIPIALYYASNPEPIQVKEESIPPNQPTTITWHLTNVPVYEGDMKFTIEVNPALPTRKWLEFLSDGTDPYKDNKATNAIRVERNQQPVAFCKVVHTENTWTTTYRIYDWRGHRETQWVSGWWHYIDGKPDHYHEGYWESYCVTDSAWSSTQTVHHYERYRITKVLFRSKLTEDTQGGWVNILNQPGKVKAGYGFEMKVIAQYETNTYTDSPKPWSSDCSGRSVTPGWSYVDPADQITVTMPFTDKSGQPMKYNLKATTSGPWYDEVQTYEMPLHNAFNMQQTRKIFVNETAKDGDYQVRIDTLPFYGTYDKPATSKLLCDRVYVTIRIVGSNKDDLKTHITQ